MPEDALTAPKWQHMDRRTQQRWGAFLLSETDPEERKLVRSIALETEPGAPVPKDYQALLQRLIDKYWSRGVRPREMPKNAPSEAPTDAQLRENYRALDSLEAMVPIFLILEDFRGSFRDEEGNIDAAKGSRSANAFSQEFAAALENKRFGNLSLQFLSHGQLYDIDAKSFEERRISFVDTEAKKEPGEREAEIANLELFVRQTFSDRVLISLSALVDWCEEIERPLPSALASKLVAVRTKGKRHGGRPPALDRAQVRKVVFELMEHHGEFVPGDDEWNTQARLEEAVRTKTRTNVAESTLRTAITPHLDAWRAEKAGN